MPPRAVAARAEFFARCTKTAAAKFFSRTKTAVEKLLEGKYADWSRDEALDLVYWWRQLFSLVCGVLWAFLKLPGLMGFFGFMGMNLASVIVGTQHVMGIEEDDWDNAQQELLGEGMPLSMPLFMVAWVFTHTLLNT